MSETENKVEVSQTPTFKFKATINGNEYNFRYSADTEEEARANLVKELQACITLLSKVSVE